MEMKKKYILRIDVEEVYLQKNQRNVEEMVKKYYRPLAVGILNKVFGIKCEGEYICEAEGEVIGENCIKWAIVATPSTVKGTPIPSTIQLGRSGCDILSGAIVKANIQLEKELDIIDQYEAGEKYWEKVKRIYPKRLLIFEYLVENKEQRDNIISSINHPEKDLCISRWAEDMTRMRLEDLDVELVNPYALEITEPRDELIAKVAVDCAHISLNLITGLLKETYQVPCPITWNGNIKLENNKIVEGGVTVATSLVYSFK